MTFWPKAKIAHWFGEQSLFGCKWEDNKFYTATFYSHDNWESISYANDEWRIVSELYLEFLLKKRFEDEAEKVLMKQE